MSGTKVLRFQVQFFEYDDSWQCATKSSIRLKGHAIVHDFGVTRKHYIVHQAPSTLNSLALSLGLQPPMSCIRHEKKKFSSDCLRLPMYLIRHSYT